MRRRNKYLGQKKCSSKPRLIKSICGFFLGRRSRSSSPTPGWFRRVCRSNLDDPQAPVDLVQGSSYCPSPQPASCGNKKLSRSLPRHNVRCPSRWRCGAPAAACSRFLLRTVPCSHAPTSGWTGTRASSLTAHLFPAPATSSRGLDPVHVQHIIDPLNSHVHHVDRCVMAMALPRTFHTRRLRSYWPPL